MSANNFFETTLALHYRRMIKLQTQIETYQEIYPNGVYPDDVKRSLLDISAEMEYIIHENNIPYPVFPSENKDYFETMINNCKEAYTKFIKYADDLIYEDNTFELNTHNKVSIILRKAKDIAYTGEEMSRNYHDFLNELDFYFNTVWRTQLPVSEWNEYYKNKGYGLMTDEKIIGIAEKYGVI